MTRAFIVIPNFEPTSAASPTGRVVGRPPRCTCMSEAGGAQGGGASQHAAACSLRGRRRVVACALHSYANVDIRYDPIYPLSLDTCHHKTSIPSIPSIRAQFYRLARAFCRLAFPPRLDFANLLHEPSCERPVLYRGWNRFASDAAGHASFPLALLRALGLLSTSGLGCVRMPVCHATCGGAPGMGASSRACVLSKGCSEVFAAETQEFVRGRLIEKV